MDEQKANVVALAECIRKTIQHSVSKKGDLVSSLQLNNFD